jgi:hypothetical protein
VDVDEVLLVLYLELEVEVEVGIEDMVEEKGAKVPGVSASASYVGITVTVTLFAGLSPAEADPTVPAESEDGRFSSTCKKAYNSRRVASCSSIPGLRQISLSQRSRPARRWLHTASVVPDSQVPIRLDGNG